jgi:DNA-binding NarL/FixJ family response regulator
MNPIRILVVDDQSLFREGLTTLLSTVPEFVVVGQAEHGRCAIQLAKATLPDVVLMDLRMPVMDGVTATRALSKELPSSRVVVLTTFDDDESIFEAIRAGALGYVLKDVELPQLVEAVRLAARGESFLTPRVATRLVQQVATQNAAPLVQSIANRLTEREREILKLLSQGASNKDIARELNLVEGTVKNHVTSIFVKLDVTDRVQAALRARELVPRIF